VAFSYAQYTLNDWVPAPSGKGAKPADFKFIAVWLRLLQLYAHAAAPWSTRPCRRPPQPPLPLQYQALRRGERRLKGLDQRKEFMVNGTAAAVTALRVACYDWPQHLSLVLGPFV
jgi:hypothetical protein